MKYIAIICVLIGFGLIGYAGKEYVEIKQSEGEATEKALELLAKKPIDKDDFSPDFNSVVGMLVIPSISGNLPIVEGTNEDDLKKGVGHYTGTAYPLENDQIFLSGHRDTVFRRLGELNIGDIMTVRMEYGDFDYEIINTKIVDADDRTIIVPHDEEILTVSTCYPFSFIGNAPDRYIIDAKPVYDKTLYD